MSSHARAQSRSPAEPTLCTPLLQVEANDKPDLRLQGLAELHNVAENAATQHAMLLQSIAYAKQADLANLLAPVIRVSCPLSCKMEAGCAHLVEIHEPEALHQGGSGQLTGLGWQASIKCFAMQDLMAGLDF